MLSFFDRGLIGLKLVVWAKLTLYRPENNSGSLFSPLTVGNLEN